MHEPTGLPLRSRHVRLRPPTRPFIDELCELAVAGAIPWRWSGHGHTPRGFAESLWHGVLVQFAVEDRRDGRSVGLVTAYDADHVHGFASVSVLVLPGYRRRVWPLEGGLLFADHLFTRYNLRNLYGVSAAPDFRRFRSGEGRLFEVQGRLPGCVIVDGEPEDLYVLCVSRAAWFDRGVRALERCRPEAAG